MLWLDLTIHSTFTVTSPSKSETGENSSLFQFDLWMEARLAAKVQNITILVQVSIIAVICFPYG